MVTPAWLVLVTVAPAFVTSVRTRSVKVVAAAASFTPASTRTSGTAVVAPDSMEGYRTKAKASLPSNHGLTSVE